MAATAYAAATAVLTPRVPTTIINAKTSRCPALPFLPSRFSNATFSSSIKQVSESRRFPLPQVRASEETSSSVDATELVSDLKEKVRIKTERVPLRHPVPFQYKILSFEWPDAVENKSTVILYGGGAIVAVWLSSILVGAINSIPLLPKIMELVGLGYTGWFVYRYLLFKSSRKELVTDIEALKKKIAGTE